MALYKSCKSIFLDIGACLLAVVPFLVYVAVNVVVAVYVCSLEKRQCKKLRSRETSELSEESQSDLQECKSNTGECCALIILS